MHGGTITSGRLHTVGVVASYWMSSMSSLRNTTLPGVTAMLRPTSNARSSVIVMRPVRASSARLRRPCTRLAPSVAHARAARTSGLVAGKLVGAIASRYCRVANSSRLLLVGRQRREARELAQVVGVEQVGLPQQREVGLLVPCGRRRSGGRRAPARRLPAGASPRRGARRAPARHNALQRAAWQAARAAAAHRAPHGAGCASGGQRRACRRQRRAATSARPHALRVLPLRPIGPGAGRADRRGAIPAWHHEERSRCVRDRRCGASNAQRRVAVAMAS